MTPDTTVSETTPLGASDPATAVVPLVVPAQMTPQNATAAKEALCNRLSGLTSGDNAHLSCEGAEVSVLALQLCHAARVAARANGIILTVDDTQLPALSNAEAPA